MRGRMRILIALSCMVLFCSCASNQILFQQRKNFHERVRINIPNRLHSEIIPHIKKERDTSFTLENKPIIDSAGYIVEKHLVSTKSPIRKFQIQEPTKVQKNYTFRNHKILKVTKVEKVQSDTAGMFAVALGVLALVFLVFSFALFHVSLSIFWSFWLAGLKLGFYSGIYGIVAVSDDDDWKAILGLILGCLAVILAFVFIAVLLL